MIFKVLPTLIFGAVFCAPAIAHGPHHRDSFIEQAEQIMADLHAAIADAQQTTFAASVAGIAPAVYADRPWLWEPGSRLRVCFWNGSPEVRDKFIAVAGIWTRHANVHLHFEEYRSTKDCADGSVDDIRVALDIRDPRDLWSDAPLPKTAAWGRIGNLRGSASPKITVNIPYAEFWQTYEPALHRFLVLHEIGHVLGLLHEHQRGACDEWFDEKAIARDTNWSESMIRANFRKFPDSNPYDIRMIGAYDKESIMQYNFKKDWFLKKDGQTNPCERGAISDLSKGDKAGIEGLYGKPILIGISDTRPSVQVIPADRADAAAAPLTLPDTTSTQSSRSLESTEIQDELARIVIAAKLISDEKRQAATATRSFADKAIEELTRPRRECVNTVFGRRIACFDKAPEDPQNRAAQLRFEEQVIRTQSDATQAEVDYLKLLKVRDLHSQLINLRP